MQPRTQIEYQLRGRAQNANKIWPVPDVANPTGKDIYWAMQDPFSLSDLKDAACYLIIGKTGSGKTTMCNAMANWAWGTEYDHKERFKLIHDELTVNGMEKYLGCSMTYRINAYFLNVTNKKFKNKKIVIIDTPGFADVNLRDQDFQANMYNFLRNTELKIQGVCFAVQAGENRATSEFTYVVSMTLDFFSKDVLENLYGMCTHASTKKPSAAKFMKAE